MNDVGIILLLMRYLFHKIHNKYLLKSFFKNCILFVFLEIRDYNKLDQVVKRMNILSRKTHFIPNTIYLIYSFSWMHYTHAQNIYQLL